MSSVEHSTRRQFLQTAGTAAMTASLAPAILGAADKAGTKKPLIGTGEYQYEVTHGWGELPAHISWGETHGVAVDSQGLVYIKHRTRIAEAPMDSIAVFDPEGKFVRSWGKQYHGGGHGIDIRKEGNEEFLYLCVSTGRVVKATLKGEEVWTKGRPTETGKYDNPEALFKPTNVCFAPDGGFYVADGYGSHFIHQYDKDAKWIRTWGGFGDQPGQFKTPHGLWLDDRPGREPRIAVCDRANARLQYFSLDGKPIEIVGGVSFPAHLETRGQVMLCPDLHARVTLLDQQNQVITHLGYDQAWTDAVLDGGKFTLRGQPANWQPGKFLHPHDACFDQAGNIFVVEWVLTGRVSFLKKVG